MRKHCEALLLQTIRKAGSKGQVYPPNPAPGWTVAEDRFTFEWECDLKSDWNSALGPFFETSFLRENPKFVDLSKTKDGNIVRWFTSHAKYLRRGYHRAKVARDAAQVIKEKRTRATAQRQYQVGPISRLNMRVTY